MMRERARRRSGRREPGWRRLGLGLSLWEDRWAWGGGGWCSCVPGESSTVATVTSGAVALEWVGSHLPVAPLTDAVATVIRAGLAAEPSASAPGVASARRTIRGQNHGDAPTQWPRPAERSATPLLRE
jgi:hypothetical protein